MHHGTPVTLDKVGVGAALMRLARKGGGSASLLYARIMQAWGARIDRTHVTLKLTQKELELFRSLRLPPGLVESVRWLAVYRDPKDPDVEVTTRTPDKPPKKRTFRSAGGNRKLLRVQLHDLTATAQGDDEMGKTVQRKKKSKKAEEAVEVEANDEDELEGLEELEDLEDVETDEPDDEPDEDDEEDEEPPKKRRKKGSSKGKKKSRKRAEQEDDDEDEEDDEDEKPKRKKSSKKKSSKKSRNGSAPPQRELPKGKLGPGDIADMAGVEARDVRAYLRREGIEKDEDLGRYAFTKKEAEKIAKAIKKAKSD